MRGRGVGCTSFEPDAGVAGVGAAGVCGDGASDCDCDMVANVCATCGSLRRAGSGSARDWGMSEVVYDSSAIYFWSAYEGG